MIDRSTHRIAVTAVAVVLGMCVLGIIVLAVLERAIPDILENVTVGSLTGLVGLLATPKQEPVQVVDHDGTPLRVRDAGFAAFEFVLGAAVAVVVLAIALRL